MTVPSFGLSSLEALRIFEELVDLSLDIQEKLSERLLAKLEEKARGLGVHRLDFHRIILTSLDRRGGMGLALSSGDDGNPVVCCGSCGMITPEVNWRCPGCGTPYAGRPPLIICPVTGMEFVFVKGGVFRMGDTFGTGDDDEKPVHEVELNGFYMGKYPVTQGEWVKVMGGNPSHFQKGDRYPVEIVSWNDVLEYIEKLNYQSGRKYRLPTEAEWEYSARSCGKQENWAGTSYWEELDEYAWYVGNSDGRTHPVGEKKPNALGLYDMSGNVWEWCVDWYDAEYYGKSPRRNPRGPEEGEFRALRGGSCVNTVRNTRATSRVRTKPVGRDRDSGFRLVLPQD